MRHTYKGRLFITAIYIGITVVVFFAGADHALGQFDLPATTTPHVIDIAIIGDNYSATDTFHRDAKRMQDHLFTFDPFLKHFYEFKFHEIENSVPLECGETQISALERINIRCNAVLVKSILNEAKVPYDKIVVIVNGLGGGIAGDIAVVSSNNLERGKGTFVHEIGHLFGLIDEYKLFKTDGLKSDSCNANCCFSNKCTVWQGIPGAMCISGCAYPNWFRSSEDSVMRSSNVPYFNIISQTILEKNFDIFTENNPPRVSFRSPEEGSFVTGLVPVRLDVSDDGRITLIEIDINGNSLFHSAFSREYMWDTNGLEAGSPHIITAKVFDAAGNATSSSITVRMKQVILPTVITAQKSSVAPQASSSSVYTPTITPLVSEITSQFPSYISIAGKTRGEQIALLRDQIRILQEKLARLTGTTTSTSSSVDTQSNREYSRVGIELILQRESRGEDVTRLQLALRSFPHFYPEGLVTGYFGALTESAVKRFQVSKRLPSTGIVDSTVLNALYGFAPSQ